MVGRLIAGAWGGRFGPNPSALPIWLLASQIRKVAKTPTPATHR